MRQRDRHLHLHTHAPGELSHLQPLRDPRPLAQFVEDPLIPAGIERTEQPGEIANTPGGLPARLVQNHADTGLVDQVHRPVPGEHRPEGDLDGGGLARPVGPDQAHHIAARHAQVQGTEAELLVLLGDPLQREEIVAGHASSL